ncbi:unnamed protein product [Sympodiomycopsis kandeliae]
MTDDDQQEREHTYPPQSSTSLYSTSPHYKADSKKRKAKHYSDPTWTLVLVLLLAVIYWSWPGIEKPWSRNRQTQQQQQQQSPYITYKMPWQTTFTLASRGKGCHLVTDEVNRQIAEGLKGTKVGILTLFIQHTSAGLSVNENFDSTVRKDMDMAFDRIVPESLPWKHTDEGPDDSASHTKATLAGSSVTIPITNGQLNLGTWQGVYLCEFRAAKHTRRIVATIVP